MPNNLWGAILGGQPAGEIQFDEYAGVNGLQQQPQGAANFAVQGQWAQPAAPAGWIGNYEKELEMYSKKKPRETTEARSASQLSDEYLNLTSQIKGLGESIHQESEELASALESLSKITEVVRDIGTVVRSRISTLQRVATQLETWRQNLPLTDSLRSEIKQSADRSAPAQVAPPAVAGAQAVAPGLWQQGPG